MIQINLWLIESKPIVFIRINWWTNTQRNIESQRCESNTRRYAMNTIMPYHWEKQMFGMQSLDIGGIPWVADGVGVQELENWPSF